MACFRSIEQFLELLHALEIALDLGLRLLAAFMLAVIGGIDVLEPHLASRLDDQLLAIVHGSILQNGRTVLMRLLKRDDFSSNRHPALIVGA
jgi:hypothetical protein